MDWLVETVQKIAPAFIFAVVYLLFSSSSAQASTLYFPHTNHQGSVIAVTDENGAVVSQDRYFSYGEERTSQGDEDISQRKYTSQIKDTESDLYYYNARYYDPALSTFISADEVGGQLNRYAYVMGNPVRLVDPKGEQADTVDVPIIDVTPNITTTGIPAPGVVVGTQTTSTVPYSMVPQRTPNPGGFLMTVGIAAAPAIILPAAAACLSNPFMCGLAISNFLNPALRSPSTANTGRRVATTTVKNAEDLFGSEIGGGHFGTTHANIDTGVVTKLFNDPGLAENAYQTQFYKDWGGVGDLPDFIGEVPGGFQQSLIEDSVPLWKFIQNGGTLTEYEARAAIVNLAEIQRLTGSAHGDISYLNGTGLPVHPGNVMIQSLPGGGYKIHTIDWAGYNLGLLSNPGFIMNEFNQFGDAMWNLVR